MFAKLASLLAGSPIRLTRVDLGDVVIDLPVADLVGHRPGKTLLVTGGVDGDEYAGILAAYQLIERNKNLDFAGRLIVIPVVNLPGFHAECSHNPIDGKFPKYVWSGQADRISGTSTDRLMNFIASFAHQADCWHDLHGGAITEGLNPFLWLYRTGNHQVDALADELVHYGVAPNIIYERTHFASKPATLAKHGCSYLIAESGSRGRLDQADVDRHLTWLTSTMQILGLIDGTPIKNSATVMTRVAYLTAPFDGLWQPANLAYAANELFVEQGTTIGAISRIDGTGNHELRAASGGTPLWWKETLRAKKGDILLAIGY